MNFLFKRKVHSMGFLQNECFHLIGQKFPFDWKNKTLILIFLCTFHQEKS